MNDKQINMQTILITGANGFVGQNLQLHLSERKGLQVRCFTRANTVAELPALLDGVDFVIHLAGVNRPQDPAEFATGNTDLTQALATAVADVALRTGKKVPVVYTSSTQAERDNPYGQSKRAAEDALFTLQRAHGVPVHVFRLPNVFGKWCKPNYNSAVATFCHHIARDLPITVNDPAAPVTLVYVDDVIARFVQIMDGADPALDAQGFATVAPQYTTTVGELAHTIQSFKDSRQTLMTERVGTGFLRALYATYVSYLPVEAFTHRAHVRRPTRGICRNAQDARLRAVQLFHGAPGHYPGRPLPPHQDREVFGDQGRSPFQVPPHANRPNPRAGHPWRQGRNRRNRAGLDARHHQHRPGRNGGDAVGQRGV